MSSSKLPVIIAVVLAALLGSGSALAVARHALGDSSNQTSAHGIAKKHAHATHKRAASASSLSKNKRPNATKSSTTKTPAGDMPLIKTTTTTTAKTTTKAKTKTKTKTITTKNHDDHDDAGDDDYDCDAAAGDDHDCDADAGDDHDCDADAGHDHDCDAAAGHDHDCDAAADDHNHGDDDPDDHNHGDTGHDHNHGGPTPAATTTTTTTPTATTTTTTPPATTTTTTPPATTTTTTPPATTTSTTTTTTPTATTTDCDADHHNHDADHHNHDHDADHHDHHDHVCRSGVGATGRRLVCGGQQLSRERGGGWESLDAVVECVQRSAVDLRRSRGRTDFSEAKLNWETAAGKDYLIQVSSDATNWTTIRTVTGNTTFGLATIYTVPPGAGQYVRITDGLRVIAVRLLAVGVLGVRDARSSGCWYRRDPAWRACAQRRVVVGVRRCFRCAAGHRSRPGQHALPQSAPRHLRQSTALRLRRDGGLQLLRG